MIEMTNMFAWKSNKRSINGHDHKKATIYQLIIALLVILVACSPKSGNQLLKIFFDGVPEKRKKDSAVSVKSMNADTAKKLRTVLILPETTALYIHAPYKERACNKCHDMNVPGKMAVSQDDVCYTCHMDFQKKYTYVHGPVAGGFCTACHVPHFSENKNLLARTGQDLCLNCHIRSEIMKTEAHADIAMRGCNDCHNAHGGKDHFFVSK